MRFWRVEISFKVNWIKVTVNIIHVSFCDCKDAREWVEFITFNNIL